MQSLIKRIREEGVILNLDDTGQLRVSFKKGSVPHALIDRIRESKTEIIDYLLTKKEIELSNAIGKAEANDSYRLSSSQFRIWILSQYEEASKAFNIFDCIPVQNNLDIPRFKRAICKTIERHEILRTVFKEGENGEVRQWVKETKELGFDTDVVDVSGMDDEGQAISDYIDRDSLRLFDLSKGPLIRCCLFLTRGEQYFFYCNMHHIITDAWSRDILKRDILSVYEGLAGSRDEMPKDLSIQYKDYAEWQQHWIGSKEMIAHKAFWLKQFSDVSDPVYLPARNVRPPVKTYDAYFCRCYLEQGLTGRFKRKCRERSESLFMGLLTNLIVLLHKYTGQSDITIGTPVSGRVLADLEDQIGCYINLLALRIKFQEEESYEALSAKVREVVTSAIKHGSFPFEMLVDELKLNKDASRTPLFDMLMLLENDTADIDKNISHPGTIEEIGRSMTKYDFSFECREYNNTIEIGVYFNTDIYEKDFVCQLLRHLVRIIGINVDDTSRPIGDIDFLDAMEKRRLIVELNDTKAFYDHRLTVLDLFDRPLSQRENEGAVYYNDHMISYGELEKLSNKFSHFLITVNLVMPGDVVAVHIPKSSWLIVALLGIFKARAVYLPLDVAIPEGRLAYIRQDTKPSLILDEQVLQQFLDMLGSLPAGRPDTRQGPQDAAYIIYTSGSTGQPKGVEISHRSLVNFLLSVRREPGIDHTDRVLSIASHSFDISLLDFLLPLVAGARLYLCDQSSIENPELAKGVIAKTDPTFMQATPTFLNLLLDSGWKGDQRLKIITTGEECKFHLGLRLLEACGELWNMYGATETTINSTAILIRDKDNIRSVGRPIDNTQVFILDNKFRLLPFGAMGEIFIGGDGLLTWYRNNPGLTEKKVIYPPFEKDLRLYRTGDLGRWLPDGSIQYLGRADHQVKIRGYRIELGEIDHALTGIEFINLAVTIVAKNEEGDDELVAYFVSDKKLGISGIRNELKKSLPAYMIPGKIMQLEAMPVTISRKIDRKSLPKAMKEEGDGIEHRFAATNDTERALIEVIATVLDIPEPNIKDDFFELGGNSVRSVMVVNRLKKYGYELNMVDLLRYPVIEQLAKVIGSLEEVKTDEPPVITERAQLQDGREFPLSVNQMLYFQNGELAPSYASIFFHLTGFDPARFLEAYRRLLEHFALLRIRIEGAGPDLVQRIMPVSEIEPKVQFKRGDLEKKNKYLAGHFALMKANPLDPFRGETIRAFVLYHGGLAYGCLSVHHVITNVKSNRMLREFLLNAYYDRHSDGDDAKASYFDFILAQRNYLASMQSRVHREFWTNQFLSRKIHSRKGIVSSEQETEIRYIRNFYIIRQSLFQRMKEYCVREKIQVNCFILSAFAFIRATEKKGTEDLFLEITVDGNKVNLFGVDNSLVVGQFVNILPVVIPSEGYPDFRRLAGQIQSAYFETLLHQHIPITEIDAEFTRIEGTSIHELSDIAYNFLDLSAERATDTSIRDSSSQSDGKSLTHNKNEIPVRAVEFANELHLEWELSCTRTECKKRIRDKFYLRELDLLLHSILDTQEDIPADFNSRNS